MSNQGVAPVNLDSPVGKTRLLIGDTDPANVADGVGTYAFYSDREIEGFIALSGSVHRAAASILRTIALTPALKLKKWSSADLSVDGAAITTSLLAAAKAAEDAADRAGGAESDDQFELVGVPHPELKGLR